MAPPVLYHYTSNVGLLGMIASQEFWFTEIRFLNDSREFRLACDALVKGIQRYAGTYRQQWLDRGCSGAEFESMVANMCNGGHYEAAFGKVAKRGHPFVFSLTEEGDLLSQWRAYGKGEYCIGFDSTKLFDLMQVNYATSDDPADLAGDLGWFFSEHLKHIRPGELSILKCCMMEWTTCSQGSAATSSCDTRTAVFTKRKSGVWSFTQAPMTRDCFWMQAVATPSHA